MKTQILTVLFFLVVTLTNGQEFSFSMYFEDAAGNKDTLVLGYDLNATDSIDNLFGEINIISQPLNNDFDVRVTDELWKRNYNPPLTPTYHTKKQIIRHPCYPVGFGYPVMSIDFKCTHWPVTVSWDSTLFADSCRTQSLFTSQHPGGWWDGMTMFSDLFRVVLNEDSDVTFTCNHEVGEVSEWTSYMNDYGDTISVFWVGLGYNLLSTDIDENEKQSIDYYFNIVSNSLTIKLDNENKWIERIQLSDLSGKTIQTTVMTHDIDISKLNKGLYLCRFTTNDKETETFKFIKQ